MKPQFRRFAIGAIAVTITSVLTGGWIVQSVPRAPDPLAHRLWEVVELIESRYVDSVAEPDLFEMATEGLLAGLDPHSRLLKPTDVSDFRFQTMGEYAGIGAEVGLRGRFVTVIAPMPDSPAERAGLRTGDRIVAIDATPTDSWSQEKVVGHLRGAAGETVTLRIARPSVDNEFDIEITRQEIVVHAVRSAFLMDGTIGYLELASFTPTSASEVRDAVDELIRAGATGLILDLRRNPGGLMEQGIRIADLFLERGTSIAELRGRDPSDDSRFLASSRDRYRDVPVVVLQSRGSASAAEIVAGALQDHARGLVIGEISYGKGLVQTMWPLESDHWLVLTTGRWYTPSGRSIQSMITGAGSAESLTDREGAVGGGGAASGGIAPDLHVPLDTLAGAERRLVQAILDQGFGRYLNARLRAAVSELAENPDLRPDFSVTSSLLDRFFGELVEEGVVLDRAAFDEGAGWVSADLGEEIAYLQWGESERRRRQNLRDAQVSAARDFLLSHDPAMDPSLSEVSGRN